MTCSKGALDRENVLEEFGQEAPSQATITLSVSSQAGSQTPLALSCSFPLRNCCWAQPLGGMSSLTIHGSGNSRIQGRLAQRGGSQGGGGFGGGESSHTPPYDFCQVPGSAFSAGLPGGCCPKLSFCPRTEQRPL